MNFIKSILYTLFVFIGIRFRVVEVLFYLMLIDSFLGIIKALRLKKKFSFKVLGWGIVSKLTLLIIPMVIGLMAKGLDFDFKYFIIAVINILIVNEGLSCITNILSIKTRKQIENADYITKLLETIRRGFMDLIKRALNTIDKQDVNKK